MARFVLFIAAIALLYSVLQSFGLETENSALVTFTIVFVFQAVVIVTVMGKPRNSNVIVLAGLLALVIFSVMAAHLVLLYLGATGGIIVRSGIVAMFTGAPLTLCLLYLGQYRRN